LKLITLLTIVVGRRKRLYVAAQRPHISYHPKPLSLHRPNILKPTLKTKFVMVNIPNVALR
jgi:hypothetical protein